MYIGVVGQSFANFHEIEFISRMWFDLVFINCYSVVVSMFSMVIVFFGILLYFGIS